MDVLQFNILSLMRVPDGYMLRQYLSWPCSAHSAARRLFLEPRLHETHEAEPSTSSYL